MSKLNFLKRDDRGVTAIEFSIAIPVLVILMLGILQFGMVLSANGAMRNALGEGLRLAKINPAATEDEVLKRTRYSLIGVDPAAISALSFERGEADHVQYGKISLTIKLNPIIPFVPLPPITLSQSKRVFLPS